MEKADQLRVMLHQLVRLVGEGKEVEALELLENISVWGAWKDVQDFHNKFGVIAPSQITPLSDANRSLRRRLINEEALEAHEALGTDDMAHIAQECVDIIVVSLGTLVSMGINVVEPWKEVQAANMRKEKAIGEGSKIRKPVGWRPPDMEDALERPVSGMLD